MTFFLYKDFFLQKQTDQGFFKVWIIATNKYIYRKYRESKACETSADDVCKRDLFLKDAKWFTESFLWVQQRAGSQEEQSHPHKNIATFSQQAKTH